MEGCVLSRITSIAVSEEIQWHCNLYAAYGSDVLRFQGCAVAGVDDCLCLSRAWVEGSDDIAGVSWIEKRIYFEALLLAPHLYTATGVAIRC
jgi:hypothetical protein